MTRYKGEEPSSFDRPPSVARAQNGASFTEGDTVVVVVRDGDVTGLVTYLDVDLDEVRVEEAGSDDTYEVGVADVQAVL